MAVQLLQDWLMAWPDAAAAYAIGNGFEDNSSSRTHLYSEDHDHWRRQQQQQQTGAPLRSALEDLQPLLAAVMSEQQSRGEGLPHGQLLLFQVGGTCHYYCYVAWNV